MYIYFFSYFICYLVGISKQKDNAFITYSIYIFLAVFLCCGYFCGSDWRQYEPMYYNIDFGNLFYGYFSEPGYYIYMIIFRYFDIDFWHFSIFTKLICFILIFLLIKKYLVKNTLLGLMYFIPWYGFFLFIDCPMRNLIAISISLLAINSIISKKPIHFFLIILLAATFHTSAVFLAICYFFVRKKVSTKCYVVLFILTNIIFASRELFIDIISFLFGGIPYVSAKIESYIIGESQYAEGRVLSLGMIIHILFFLLLITKRSFVEQSKNGVVIFNFAILYLLLYRLSTTIEIFARFQLYTSPFFCIAIILLTHAFVCKVRLYYVTYLLLVASIGTVKIFADYRYIPYSNYIPYFITDKYPTFDYRSSYNYKFSPYADK